MKTVAIECRYCDGQGKVKGISLWIQCLVCEGRKINYVDELHSDCPVCKGSGRKEKGTYHIPCGNCEGFGVVSNGAQVLDKAQGSTKTIPLALTNRATHLDHIFHKNDGKVFCSIVFIDIVKYSSRLIISQLNVINQFNSLIQMTFAELDKEFSEGLNRAVLNLETDTIKLPIGDGIAVGFTFQGLDNIHVRFAEILLKIVKTHSEEERCEDFETNEFCDYHSHLKVRIGIGRGECIVYKDVNKNYNLAGTEINWASRVMSMAGPNQIVFTAAAYHSYVNFNGGHAKNLFVPYLKVEIKNGGCLDAYHYTNGIANEPQLNDIKRCENTTSTTQPINPKESTHDDPRLLILSVDALHLLATASEDLINGQILFVEYPSGFRIQANQITLNQSQDAREKARWLAVIDELEEQGFIEENLTSKHRTFEITGEGYKFLELNKV